MAELTELDKEQLRNKEFFTVAELAEALSVPTRTIHKLIKDKKLRCFVIGSSKRITRSMLEDFIEKNELRQVFHIILVNSNQNRKKLKFYREKQYKACLFLYIFENSIKEELWLES